MSTLSTSTRCRYQMCRVSDSSEIESGRKSLQELMDAYPSLPEIPEISGSGTTTTLIDGVWTMTKVGEKKQIVLSGIIPDTAVFLVLTFSLAPRRQAREDFRERHVLDPD